MANFFNYYPVTYYSSNNTTSLDVVTNIISRFSFEQKLKENSSVFYEYQVKDSDTPEIIAAKYYDNPERHWIILLFNDIIDPQFDWPLESRTLIKYIDEKYSANGAANTTPVSGIRWAQNTNNVKNYYKVITNTTSENEIVMKVQVDANTYANIASTTQSYNLQNSGTVTQKITKETETYYDYEVKLNESKRTIKLLKRDFVPLLEEEFRNVLS